MVQIKDKFIFEIYLYLYKTVISEIASNMRFAKHNIEHHKANGRGATTVVTTITKWSLFIHIIIYHITLLVSNAIYLLRIY